MEVFAYDRAVVRVEKFSLCHWSAVTAFSTIVSYTQFAVFGVSTKIAYRLFLSYLKI